MGGDQSSVGGGIGRLSKVMGACQLIDAKGWGECRDFGTIGCLAKTDGNMVLPKTCILEIISDNPILEKGGSGVGLPNQNMSAALLEFLYCFNPVTF